MKRLIIALGLLLLSLTGPAFAGNDAVGHNSPGYATSQSGFGQAVDLSANGNGAGTTLPGSKYLTLPTGGPYEFPAGTSWTVEGWIKPSTVASGQAVLSDADSAGHQNWYVSLAGSSLIAGGQGMGDLTGTAINTTVWHHFALVMTSGTAWALYVDGTRAATATGTYAVWPSATVYVGTTYTGAYAYAGLMDEFSFSTTAQYTGATYTVPAAPFANGRAGQVALYHLDSALTDSGGAAGGALTAGTLTPGTPTGNAVPATWTAATGGTGPYTYQLQVAPDVAGGPGTFVNAGSSGSGTSGSATGLSGRTKYWLQVVATDSAGTPATVTYPAVFATTGAATPSGTTYPYTSAAAYGAFASGLGLGYTIYDNVGNTITAHTTSGVVEYGGVYVLHTNFDTTQSGVIVWDAPAGSSPWTSVFSPAWTPGDTVNVTGGATVKVIRRINWLPSTTVPYDLSAPIFTTRKGNTHAKAA